MFRVIAQPREEIAAFVSARQQQMFPWGRKDNYTTLGLMRGEYLIAGIVYNNFEARNVCAHIAAIEGKSWLTREYLFAMFDYPFNQLDKRRITALVARSNHTCRRFIRGLGFVLEGKLTDYYDKDDMLVFGLTKANCRWLHLAPRMQMKEAA